jgi:hypothetical protein
MPLLYILKHLGHHSLYVIPYTYNFPSLDSLAISLLSYYIILKLGLS